MHAPIFDASNLLFSFFFEVFVNEEKQMRVLVEDGYF
jgi:hypothetical protein